MIVFQVSPNFDPAKKVPKIWCQIYIFMNKVIILRKIQVRMKTFNSAFINHFSLSLNRCFSSTHASAVNLLDIRMGNLDWNESHVKETDSADDLLQ